MEMIERGLRVTINSDDPAYFGGYIDDNYRALASAFDLSVEQLAVFARNSIEASFIGEGQRRKYLALVEDALAS